MPEETQRKLAVITGASSGIGAATAIRLAKSGYRVILVARNEEKLKRVADEIGETAVVEVCDGSNGELVNSLVHKILKEHGTPDVIVNAAGAGEWKRIEETPPAEIQQMMDAPFFSAFHFTSAFMPSMLERNRGVIINVGSPVSILTWPNCTGYAAARWALRGLNEALHQDLQGANIHSCHVVFGKVSSSYFENNPNSEEKIPGIAKTIRTIKPEECASVIERAIQHPKRQIVYPFMLKVYDWFHAACPWMTRWLLKATS